MSRSHSAQPFTPQQAAALLSEPDAQDDKYSRGAVGFVTGSDAYPGAAVLGTSAALYAGAGYVRFVGERRVGDLVLQAHPEVVCGTGRADAWVIGSGIDQEQRSTSDTNRLLAALASGQPVIIDAGALDLAGRVTGPAVLTPHAGELSRVFAAHDQTVSRADIAEHPETWAATAAELTGNCVLLKGHQSVVAAPGGTVWLPEQGSAWLSVAGTGDVLAGALGTIVAAVWARRAGQQHADTTELLAQCAAAAVTVHSRASHRIPTPFTATELAVSLRDARNDIAAPGSG